VKLWGQAVRPSSKKGRRKLAAISIHLIGKIDYDYRRKQSAQVRREKRQINARDTGFIRKGGKRNI